MKMLRIMTLATAMLLATTSARSSSFESGNSLLEDCSISETEATYYQVLTGCNAYITAISDASQCGNDINGYSWQAPSNVTRGQLRKVVSKWLNEHPENLHFGAEGLVAKALQDAFPCK